VSAEDPEVSLLPTPTSRLACHPPSALTHLAAPLTQASNPNLLAYFLGLLSDLPPQDHIQQPASTAMSPHAPLAASSSAAATVERRPSSKREPGHHAQYAMTGQIDDDDEADLLAELDAVENKMIRWDRVFSWKAWLRWKLVRECSPPSPVAPPVCTAFSLCRPGDQATLRAGRPPTSSSPFSDSFDAAAPNGLT
jgi:hypothetical protein